MWKIWYTVLAVLLFVVAAVAQTKAPEDKFEVGVYGTFVRADVTIADIQHPQLSRDETRDAFGGMVEGSYYFNDGPIAYTTSVSVNRIGNYKFDVVTAGITGKIGRKKKVALFGTAGFGASRQTNITLPASAQPISSFGVGGAFTVGGGIEIKASRRIGIVPIRADYIKSDLFHNAPEVPSRDNLRLSIGILVHW